MSQDDISEVACALIWASNGVAVCTSSIKQALFLAFFLTVSGCHSCSSEAGAEKSDGAPAISVAAPGDGATPSALSLPLAAALAKDAVYVAGLVAERKAINLSRYALDGRLQWSIDVLDDVRWTPTSELWAFAGEAGAAVSLRGRRGDKSVLLARSIDSTGKTIGDAFDVTSHPCATVDSLYWSEKLPGGGVRVNRRALAGGPVTSPAEERDSSDVSLACGDKQVFLLEENDESFAVRALDAPKATVVAFGEGDDEPRERPAFTVKDELGVLVVTTVGRMQLRFPAVGPPRALRKLNDEEDLVAVDSDGKRALVVYTRDDPDRCGSDGLVSDVRALDVPLDGAKEQDQEVERGRCDVDLGPFWTGSIAGKMIIVWEERDAKKKGGAPVTGLGYRVLGDAAATHLPLSAEDLAFAGCTPTKCYVVALERPAGTDGMVPGSAKIVAFP